VTTQPELLYDGLRFGESPRWHDGRLWLSNWIAQEIVAIDLDGNAEVMARGPAPIPFCIDFLADGSLLVVSGPERLVLRHEPDGTFVTHADLTALSEFACNEIVVDGRGNAFVNGTGFDMMSGQAPAPGLVAVVMPDGSARQVAGGVMFPNGMAVTPDDATLIVAESYANQLTAFAIGEDGELSEGRVWADLGDGVPDGICIDAEGAVWYADVPNARCVRVAQGGEVLDTIAVDRGCFACMLGGEDGDTLFIVAAKWPAVLEQEGTGQVLIAPAPAPHAGRP
jgi:sugar lactone lactonase YvrE